MAKIERGTKMKTQRVITELQRTSGEWEEEVDGEFVLIDGIDEHDRNARDVAADVLATHTGEWNPAAARVVSRDDDTWGDVLATVARDDA